jgi:Heparinase II/III-like protein/Heparinase II/III N-terminus
MALADSASRWDADSKPRLWCFEHQYHRELVSAALMTHAEGERWTAIAMGHVTQWRSACPPPRGDAWESYPVARRILNWALAGFLDPNLGARLASMLAYQVNYLSRRLEWHLLGNHLLCDAAALVAGGAALSGREADRAWRAGEALLASELRRQVLPDGGYAERTVQYHAIVLQDVLVAAALSRAAGRTVRVDILSAARAMAEWLTAVVALGRVPAINDAAADATPSLTIVLSLAASLGLVEPRWDGWLGRAFGGLDVEAAPPSEPVRDVALPSTGWYVAREEGHELLFDHGPIGPDEQPGHGHSDALSYELVWAGVPVVTDSGVTTYEIGEVRAFERAARAHATVTVDGRGADELWAAFRVGARGRPTGSVANVTPDGVRVLAGTHMAPAGWTHRRILIYSPGDALVVIDRVLGTAGAIASHVPLAPECDFVSGLIRLRTGETLCLELLVGTVLSAARGKESPRNGWCSGGFGRPIARTSLAIDAFDGRIAYAIRSQNTRVEVRADRCIVQGARGITTVNLAELL